MQICRKINIIESTVQREMMQEFFLQLIRVLLGRLRDIQRIKCQQKKPFFQKDNPAFGLEAIHVLMQSTGVSFWCLQVQKYKRESIPGPKVGLLGILGKIYFLVNEVGQSLRFASWYPVVSAPQTHTAMRKPRWWHSTTTHQPLRGILWAPLLQFYFASQRHV